MDLPLLTELFNAFRMDLEGRRPRINQAPGRFPKREVFLALAACKCVLTERFSCPVRSRWSVGILSTPSDTDVIEYMVDYSISRLSIPQAIRQSKEKLPELVGDQKYGMLLAVESELGNDVEVARDFLKLLDFKAPIKWLIFRKRRNHEELYVRLSWVLSHHLTYDANDSILLIGLPKARTANLLDDIEVKCVENMAIVAL